MKVKVEKLVFGGKGFSRMDGKVVFVNGGLPGDVVEVVVREDKGSYAEAEIVEIVEPSTYRIEPPCPVFERCGGCQWQHLEYTSQLTAKENILRETLRRIGGFSDIQIEPIVPSPKQYEYRTRVTLTSWLEGDLCKIGYYKEESSDKVQVVGCPIASQPIDEGIAVLSELLAQVEFFEPTIDKIHIATDGELPNITLVPLAGVEPEELFTLVDYLSGYLMHVSVFGEEEAQFDFSLVDYKFTAVPSVFIQANREINEEMMKTVADWAGLSGDEKVLDLYSGIGNFSIPLAERAREVTGVEISEKSVELADTNTASNSIDNIEFIRLSSEPFIEGCLQTEEKFDLIVLDPPREGAKDIIDGLTELSPEKIIYVSCDPPTLARDLKNLAEGGYEIVRIKPFDMFPQTYHIESVVLLARDG